MKNQEQPLHSLMKISPRPDVYHEPKQKYSQKGQWFGVNCEEDDADCNKKKPQGFRARKFGTA